MPAPARLGTRLPTAVGIRLANLEGHGGTIARYTYERLSAQDASFLWAERPNQPMHMGGLAIYEAGPLRRGTGVDVEQIRHGVESVLHWIPRYRQKLAWTPVEGWPIWVDDRRFDLGYHIRHIALPAPGRTEQLKELAARINARPLDRAHPLWELWVIEGIADRTQFAVLNKVHHCMIDGAAGADLSQILNSPSPKPRTSESVPYMPRPAPRASELVRDAWLQPLGRSLHLLQQLRRPGRETVEGWANRCRALVEMLRFLVYPASGTPLNGELGPHRRMDWMTMPLEDVRELKRALGCTINDVVLASVAGAVRRYLFRRRADPRRIRFRVAAPVSTRSDRHERRQGNHVSTWIVTLPLVEDPLERVRQVQQQTEAMKRSRAALAVDTLMQLAEWMPAPVVARGASLAEGPANMIVTNVRGPDFPLYMAGARMLGLYPTVPLLPGGGLGVALFSYDDRLCWGFNGDHELVPDLPTFVDDARVAFEELRAATVAHLVERRTAPAEAPDAVESGAGASGASAPARVEPERVGRAQPAANAGMRANSGWSAALR